MAELPLDDAVYEVVCPHCKKQFAAELISGAAPRYQGFKCPHCRLFVPYRTSHAAGGGPPSVRPSPESLG